MCDCPAFRAQADRIEHLEEVIAYYEHELKAEAYQSPPEWCLTAQESVLAALLAARRKVTRGSAMTAFACAAGHLFDEKSPDRHPNLVSVVVARLRAKLADFGWVIPKANQGMGYAIPTEQWSDYRAAMTGDGPIAYPSITSGRRAAE